MQFGGARLKDLRRLVQYSDSALGKSSKARAKKPTREATPKQSQTAN